jgi:hypothetical protein
MTKRSTVMGKPSIRYLLVLAMSLWLGSAWAQVAATIESVTGVAHVHSASGQFSLASQGVPIHIGDTVQTEDNSTALLVFPDGTQAALRPTSSYQINNYAFQRAIPSADTMVTRLLKGGLRLISGLISKRGDPNAFKLQAATATVGIRGTDFLVRMCESDCQAEQSKAVTNTTSVAEQAGRVVRLQGRLIASNSTGGSRNLSVGAMFFEGEQLQVLDGGPAVIVTTDGTRVVLEQSSRFLVQQYKFNSRDIQSSSQLFKLLQGTMRAISGVVAKYAPKQVHYNAVTATIGIRGTNFDVVCRNAASNGSANTTDDSDANICGAGLYVYMREGSTEITPGASSIIITKGQTAFVEGPNAQPQLLDQTPVFILDDKNPLPEDVQLDFEALFGRKAQSVPEGVYVEVADGRVSLSQGGSEILLDKGESGFAPKDGAAPLKLVLTPSFLDGDIPLGGISFLQTSMCFAH